MITHGKTIIKYPETNSSPLKIGGWETIWGILGPIFSAKLLLFGFRKGDDFTILKSAHEMLGFNGFG